MIFNGTKTRKTIEDLLQGKCSIDEVMITTSVPNLDLICAPNPEKGREILIMDAKWHARALQNILEAVSILRNDHNYKWIFFDNQSGVSLNAINFLTVSTTSIVVLRPSRYAVEGTFQLSQTIFKKLSLILEEKKREDFLVWNQVPRGKEQSEIDALISTWNSKFENTGIKNVAIIPYNPSLAANLFIQDEYDIGKLVKFFGNSLHDIFQAI
jgi:MinD-like ATPase involved in chromosome partitioning or flagellar assembly